MSEELRQLLIDADSTLSLIYYRAGNTVPWEALGGIKFKEECERLIYRLRSAYESERKTT